MSNLETFYHPDLENRRLRVTDAIRFGLTGEIPFWDMQAERATFSAQTRNFQSNRLRGDISNPITDRNSLLSEGIPQESEYELVLTDAIAAIRLVLEWPAETLISQSDQIHRLVRKLAMSCIRLSVVVPVGSEKFGTYKSEVESVKALAAERERKAKEQAEDQKIDIYATIHSFLDVADFNLTRQAEDNQSTDILSALDSEDWETVNHYLENDQTYSTVIASIEDLYGEDKVQEQVMLPHILFPFLRGLCAHIPTQELNYYVWDMCYLQRSLTSMQENADLFERVDQRELKTALIGVITAIRDKKPTVTTYPATHYTAEMIMRLLESIGKLIPNICHEVDIDDFLISLYDHKVVPFGKSHFDLGLWINSVARQYNVTDFHLRVSDGDESNRT